MNSSGKTSVRLLAAGLALAALAAHAQNPAAPEKYAPPPPPAVAGTPLSTTPPPDVANTPARSREITVEQFMAIDTDMDGRVSLDEFTASPILGGKDGAAPRSGAGGTPRSAETTQAEPETRGRNTPELFHRLDKNGNGYLNSTEIAAFYETDEKL